ncbi:MAG: methylated-DNA--[protein]-cysteine S-methyltransferase [Rikenellaceae bacterium]
MRTKKIYSRDVLRAGYRLEGSLLCTIEYRGERLCALRLSVEDEKGEKQEDYDCHSSFSDRVYDEVVEYFEGRRTSFSFEVDYSSYSPFAQRVFRELTLIPYGETRSYKDIAVAVGSPLASKAIGRVCNLNPFHLIVPCHRVVGSGGRLVGYRGGLALKSALLTLERGGGGLFDKLYQPCR